MKITAFAEGAFPDRGGIGFPGTQTILASVASEGNNTVLFVAGAHTPGRERFIAADANQALLKPEGKGTYGIVSFPSAGFFSFSRPMIGEALRHVRDADFVSLHSFYSFPVLLGYTMARLFRKPYGIWPHGVFGVVNRRNGTTKKRIYDRIVGRHILKHASVIFYSAKGERNEAEALKFNVPSVIIPDGLDPNDLSDLPARGKFRQRYFAGHQGPLIVFVARLTAKKGIDLLAHSMALISASRPDVRLAIVGGPHPPPFLENVQQWIADRNISSVTVVTGQISHKEKLEALVDADLFVLPSEAENFGFSMFEAMACGVPVVVSDTLDYAPEVAAANAGLVVPREAQAFAHAFMKLIADPALRSEQGKNGIQLAHAFSSRQTGVNLDRTIRSIVNGEPLPTDLAKPDLAAPSFAEPTPSPNAV